MDSATNIISNLTQRFTNTSAKATLRGEVAFERWYFHYQPASATKELGQVSSRVWAVAYTIESFIKTFTVAISILLYAYMQNESEIDTRTEVLISQGNSLFYSLVAVIHPETARENFKEANTIEEISRRVSSRFVKNDILPKNYTIYQGDITLKMLINTH